MYDALVPKKRAASVRAAGPKPTRAEGNAVLRKVVGKRMADARGFNGWDQSEAAKKLGYKNSTQLSLVEQAKRLPPHEVLIKASTVYGVSMDFLYGLSDEPERDPKAAERNAAMRHVHDLIDTSSRQMVTLLHQYITQGAPSIMTAKSLTASAQRLVDEIYRSRALHPAFFDDKLKNGARLVHATVAVAGDISRALDMLTRHERLMEFKMRTDKPLPLFDAADLTSVQGRLM